MRGFLSRKTVCLLFVSIYLLFHVQPSFAQTEDFDYTATPTPIGYQLPYPGLLPDHPFYALKQFRDTLFGFFISNPLEKAEYNLLQSDKRFEASSILLDKKKNVDLSAETVAQAVMYYEKSVATALAAKQQGIYTTDFFRKLTTANRKHQDIVNRISERYPEKFEKYKKKLKEFGKKVSPLQDQI